MEEKEGESVEAVGVPLMEESTEAAAERRRTAGFICGVVEGT